MMSDSFKKSIDDILSDENRLKAVADKQFDKYDEDGSGTIDIKEFRTEIQALYTKLGKKPPTKRKIHEMMEKIDKNGDMLIDREEYVAHVKFILEGMRDGTLGV
uniref:EF-hand domain-containing protein n=1 Tax=Euplotes harpa TaxID=151035 RepID=A0A7S3J443_9SPIT|mmetsp:Transcript_13622/g.15801  ORF Transcript_13622/g.15801 Transcript_13622/m.15801 type:complete len:104 (+) Transcript_13622:3-314(+)